MLRSLALAFLILAGGTGYAADRSKGDEPEKSADSAEKMICKRFPETGSLVKTYRICKTKREWERGRDNVRNLNAPSSCGNLGTGGVCS